LRGAVSVLRRRRGGLIIWPPYWLAEAPATDTTKGLTPDARVRVSPLPLTAQVIAQRADYRHPAEKPVSIDGGRESSNSTSCGDESRDDETRVHGHLHLMTPISNVASTGTLAHEV
jgi:hypothetical protein